jgi:hypothetical protein
MLKRLWCKIWGHKVSFELETPLNNEEQKAYNQPMMKIRMIYYDKCPRCGRRLK